MRRSPFSLALVYTARPIQSGMMKSRSPWTTETGIANVLTRAIVSKCTREMNFQSALTPWNEHPPGHVLSGSEWGLQDEGTRVCSRRELSRDRTAEGMTKENEPVRCHAEAVARVLQRGQRVTSRRRIGRNASEAIVSAVLRQHDAQVRALDDVSVPRE